MEPLADLARRCMAQARTAPASHAGACRAQPVCERCGGSGWLEVDRNTVKPCPCVEELKARKRLEASGLSGVIERLTFDAYRTREPWQAFALQTARAWTDAILAGDKPWMFFGGAVGSGKTHLCTAACGELLKRGVGVRYMLWPEESRRLRACVTEEDAFDELTYPLKKAPVLYVDDLFKVQRGSTKVTPAEVRVAFELLDARYRMNKPTVISTEWMEAELMDMDEGTFSRMHQMAKGYVMEIGRKEGRNMRLIDFGTEEEHANI